MISSMAELSIRANIMFKIINLKANFLFYTLIAMISGCGGGDSGSGGAGGTGGSGGNNTVNHTIQTIAGSGGTISPQSRTIANGQTTTFTVTANSGYAISTVTGCGGTLSGNTYTTAPITAACTINASFSLLSYTVNTETNGGGSISPSTINVAHGQTTEFTLQSQAGYQLNSVTGCGGQLNGNQYITGSITAACVVKANFSEISYTITASASSGGSISPTSTTGKTGEVINFSLSAENGYQLKTVSGCNGTLNQNQYSVTVANTNCHVSAEFETIQQFTVTAGIRYCSNCEPQTATVSPEQQNVRYLEKAQVAYHLNAGYYVGCIDCVMPEGKTRCPGTGNLYTNRYETDLITRNCHIELFIERIKLQVTITSEGAGEVVITDEQKAKLYYGTDVEIYILPNAGHGFEVSGCNGSTNTTNNPQLFIYEIKNITESCELHVVFSPKQAEITASSTGNGSITPASIAASYNDVNYFTLAPDNGFRVNSVQGCNGDFYPETNQFIVYDITQNCSITASFTNDDIVTIPDTNLEKLIRQQINKPEGELTQDDMLQIIELRLHFYGAEAAESDRVVDLQGLQYAKNLQSIDFFQTGLRNILPLGSLEQLTSISAIFNDISFVPSFKAAHVIQLPLNNIRQVFGLAESSARIISFDHNPLQSLPAFNNAELSVFSMSYTRIRDLGFLKGASKLKQLYAYDSLVYNIDALADTGLTENAEIRISGCIDFTLGSKYSHNRDFLDVFANNGNVVDITPNHQETYFKGSINTPERCNYPEIQVNANINYTDTHAQISWEISNHAGNKAYFVEFHNHLDEQQHRLPIQHYQSSASNDSYSLNLSTLTDTVKLSAVFFNGFGQYARVDFQPHQKATPNNLHLIKVDWAQRVIKTSPMLVPDIAAMLRVQLQLENPNTAPDLTARVYTANQTYNLSFTPPSKTSNQPQHRDQEYFYRLVLSKELMQPGITIDILQGNQLITQLQPNFSQGNEIRITFIPLLAFNTSPDLDAFVKDINERINLLPISKLDYDIGNAIVITEGMSTSDIIALIEEKRATDQATHYYYGLYDSDILANKFNIMRGLGLIGGYSGYGPIQDPGLLVFQHEIGHNLGSYHVPCDVSGHFSYPYPTNSIGSVGKKTDGTLYLPENHADLMSYCSPQYISDYSYEFFQDALQRRAEVRSELSGSRIQANNTADIIEPAVLFGSIENGNIKYKILENVRLPDKGGIPTQLLATTTTNETIILDALLYKIDHAEGESYIFYAKTNAPRIIKMLRIRS